MVSETLHPRFDLELGNVEVAFSHVPDSELREALWLFTLMRSPQLVRWGSRTIQWALKLHLPILGLVKRTLFRQFCGGETPEACAPLIQRLATRGAGVILDYAVEGMPSEADYDRTAAEVVAGISMAKTQAVPFVVFKMSGVARFSLLERVSAGGPLQGEDTLEWQRVRERVRMICSQVAAAKVRVLIDAEESWIQAAIDELVTAMMEEFNREGPVVYLTLQLYRHDRLAALQAMRWAARSRGHWLGVKIVRGAYLEKERERAARLGYPSPLHASKGATDEAYNAAVLFCLDELMGIGILAGTHNEASTRLLAEGLVARGLSANDSRVVFSQLLGMSDHLTFNLAYHGFHSLKLVPYGPVDKTLPYLFRRAEENTSVQSQTGRERVLRVRELARRAEQSRPQATS